MQVNSEAQQIILRALQSVKHVVRGHDIDICCPFHDENTPSCGVVVSPAAGKPIGTFYCFGCGTGGGWNKLAEKAGFETISKKDSKVKKATFNKEEAAKLKAAVLGKTDKLVSTDSKPYPFADKDWRGLNGDLIRALGGKMITNKYGTPMLRLPVRLLGKHVTFIKARLKKREGFKSYIMDNSVSTKSKGLFPYDFVDKLLRKNQTWDGKPLVCRVVFLVEGPRDALRLIEAGIPALALLGTHSWSEKKARYVKILCTMYDLHCVVMMDSDKAGMKAQKMVSETMKNFAPTHQIKLNVQAKKWAKENKLKEVPDLDPMGLPPKLFRRIRRFAKRLH